MLPIAVLIGIGPWGALAGFMAFGFGAVALGAPQGLDSWSLAAGLLGALLGYPVSCWIGLRLVRRRPRGFGTVVAGLAGLAVASTLAGPSGGWDDAALYFGPGLVLASALTAWSLRRRRTLAEP